MTENIGDLTFRQRMIIDREKPLRGSVDVRESAVDVSETRARLAEALGNPEFDESKREEAERLLHQLEGAEMFAKFVTGEMNGIEFDRLIDEPADKIIESVGLEPVGEPKL